MALYEWALRHAGFSSCSPWAQKLWLSDSRAQAQYLCRVGLVALQQEESSQPGFEPVSLAQTPHH